MLQKSKEIQNLLVQRMGEKVWFYSSLFMSYNPGNYETHWKRKSIKGKNLILLFIFTTQRLCGLLSNKHLIHEILTSSQASSLSFSDLNWRGRKFLGKKWEVDAGTRLMKLNYQNMYICLSVISRAMALSFFQVHLYKRFFVQKYQ